MEKGGGLLFQNVIKSETELRELLGEPSDLVKRKSINYLDQHCQQFIQKSPFLMIGSSNHHGFCDVSPRGDHSGFVHILNENYLLIPERPGNKRADTLTNILQNPYVGILFLIPNLGETLRVNGTATMIRDEHLLQKMAVRNKMPLVAIAVKVEECFIHCAKSIKRSKLWYSETWFETEQLPKPAKILADHAKLPNIDEQTIAERLEQSYQNRLY